MNTISVSAVLARANASMTGADFDVTGVLARLLTGITDALPARAAAVLVDADGSLEVLAATPHRAADLEQFQAQVEQGPCLDALRTGLEVHAVGAEALVERWPVTGPAILAAGYTAVQAVPLQWHGSVFGALNVFREEEVGFEQQQAECRALADAVTLVVVSARLGPDHVTDGLRSALAERAVVEQAKGALAQSRGLDMATSFEALVALADDEDVTLGVAARRVMHRARSGTLGVRPPAS
jgi:transcriptional regulator with GAF, ATPase, and Fis domain